ncbi:hypothetical protein J2T57_001455 [Natronocella acetinitrilica]|uniref:Uncharacterized protein n=1 Tax=Natronocella acetinitrilica TaxID=414046 RepID=A0AAE3G4P6_9GAMM|nr:hypothetical protein [Natronocella acetinitrilica]MCP1674353.1 hypothetical protein [Natronocella acetinitrilica]
MRGLGAFLLHLVRASLPRSRRSLTARITALESECERLRAAFVDQEVRELLLHEMTLDARGINMRLEGGACRLLAEAFAQQFVDAATPNYIEMSLEFRSKSVMPGERLVVTLQRLAGKTPHQLRAEAEARLADLETAQRSPQG